MTSGCLGSGFDPSLLRGPPALGPEEPGGGGGGCGSGGAGRPSPRDSRIRNRAFRHQRVHALFNVRWPEPARGPSASIAAPRSAVALRAERTGMSATAAEEPLERSAALRTEAMSSAADKKVSADLWQSVIASQRRPRKTSNSGGEASASRPIIAPARPNSPSSIVTRASRWEAGTSSSTCRSASASIPCGATDSSAEPSQPPRP